MIQFKRTALCTEPAPALLATLPGQKPSPRRSPHSFLYGKCGAKGVKDGNYLIGLLTNSAQSAAGWRGRGGGRAESPGLIHRALRKRDFFFFSRELRGGRALWGRRGEVGGSAENFSTQFQEWGRRRAGKGREWRAGVVAGPGGGRVPCAMGSEGPADPVGFLGLRVGIGVLSGPFFFQPLGRRILSPWTR